MPSAQTIADLAIEFSSFGLADLERDIDRALKAGGTSSRKSFQPAPHVQMQQVFDQLLNDQQFLKLSAQEQFDIQERITREFEKQVDAQDPLLAAGRKYRQEMEGVAKATRRFLGGRRGQVNEQLGQMRQAMRAGTLTTDEFRVASRKLVREFREQEKQSSSTAKATRMLNMQSAQASFAVQDFAVVLAGGGPNSLERASIAASNNMAQIAALSGGMGGAIAGVGLTLGSIVIPNLLELAFSAEDASSSLETLESALAAVAKAGEEMEFSKDLKEDVKKAARGGMDSLNKFLGETEDRVDEIAGKLGGALSPGEMAAATSAGMTTDERRGLAQRQIFLQEGEQAAKDFQRQMELLPTLSAEEQAKAIKRREDAVTAALTTMFETGKTKGFVRQPGMIDIGGIHKGRFSEGLGGIIGDQAKAAKEERDKLAREKKELEGVLGKEDQLRAPLLAEEVRQAGVDAKEHFKKMAQDRADEFQKEQDARNKFQEGLDKFLQSPLDKVDKLRHKTADWLDAIDEKVGQQLLSVGQGDANRLSVLRKQEGAVQEIIAETEKKIEKLTRGKTEFFGLSDFAKRIQESIGQDDTAEQLKKLQDIQQRALQTLKDIRDEINLPGTFTP